MVAQVLLGYGADPNQADARGCCPLYYALHRPGSKSALSQLLLDHGATKIGRNLLEQAKEIIRIEKEHEIDWFTLLKTTQRLVREALFDTKDFDCISRF